jgi:15-cis-phytoene synthase
MSIATPVCLSLSQSHAWCERLARREAGNFYHAFRLLPADQRRAMCSLYAFMRIADDLADGPGHNADKHLYLESWRRQLAEALGGEDCHPLHPALRQTMIRYEIPSRYLEDVLDGVTMDLDTHHYDTFAELYPYCYRVASAVGLACIHIWGFQGERALACAESAGIALQLTNILRDLGEDADRGRVYLPREDLQRFGYEEECLSLRIRDERFRDLMRFQVDRAQGYYAAAEPLLSALRPAGRAVFLVMLRTYHGLLKAIVRRDYDVFSSRVRLSKMHKLWLAARALPVRWGWL